MKDDNECDDNYCNDNSSDDKESLDLIIIGAGGYGKVYQLPNGNVIKAIYGKDACGEARLEFNKQLKIYQSFERLKEIKGENDLIKLVNKYVVISKPIGYKDKSVFINNTEYTCSITMSKLNGITIRDFIKLDSSIESRFDNGFLKERGLDFQMMAHLALNSEIPGVWGVNYTKTSIGLKNPPRGYFITENSNMLDKIRENFILKLSNKDLKKIIGFIYGRILFDTNIIPIDIEIALGIYDGNFKINVLDFGMTFDLDKVKDNPVLPRTAPFFDIINDKGKSVKEKRNEIIETARNDISIDLYGDINDDKYNIKGFINALDIST